MSSLVIRIYTPGPFWQPLDYLLLRDSAVPQVGARVRVTVRNRSCVGIIAAVDVVSHMPPHKLKWVDQIIDDVPLFDQKQLAFYQWLADYYHVPMGDICALAMPKLLRDGKAIPDGCIRAIRLTEAGRACDVQVFKRSPKQLELWQRLCDLTFLPAHQLKALGINPQIVKSMQTKGMLEYFMHAACDEAISVHQNSLEKPLVLTEKQNEAVRQILSSQNIFQTFLLNGITGSGKTEVYLQVIQHILKQGQQALVLVPEIGLTPQTMDRFVRRFGQDVVALHSGLNDTERMQAWLSARSGAARVLIGTRSAIFAPFKNLGVIIVDEEHDASFKQHDGIRYSARDAAIVLANLCNIPIVLGSATPSSESWFNAEKHRYIRIDLPERSAGAALPSWHLIDLRNKSVQEGLSQDLLDAMTKHLEQKKQVLLFLNRRGFSPAWVCHACGFSPHCSHCDAAMTYHTQPVKLVCHHCGHQQKIHFTCQKCSSPMHALGQGTQRIEQALRHYFPHTPILRIDRDSTAQKNSFAQMLEQVHQGEPQILIGTQMVAKGHHFPQVTMVGVLNADGGLYSADFRAAEHIAQLMMQVAGRAGRAEHPGEVYVQTYWPDHPLWQHLFQVKGYELFMQTVLKQRSLAQLPPVRFAAIVRAEAKNAQLPQNFLHFAAERAQAMMSTGVSVLGPINALHAKRAGFYRSQLLLISTNRAALQHLLKNWIPELSAHKQSHRVRWHLDVDPLEFD